MTIATPHPHRPGSAYFYDKGCRCSECHDDKMEKRKRYRDLARRENRPSYRRELETSRRLKREYVGTCERCGAKTTGSDGPGSAPTVCRECAPAVYGPKWSAERLGKGKRIEALLAFLATGQKRYAEIRSHLGITDGHTTVLLNRHVRSGLIVRVGRGLYRLP